MMLQLTADVLDPKKFKDELKEICKQNNISMSKFVGLILSESMDKNKKKPKKD